MSETEKRMRKAILIGATGLSLAFGAGSDALSMGGMGGPSDAWGSPYVLYAPQSFPGTGLTSERPASDVGRVDHNSCRGDRACKPSSKTRRRPKN